MGDIGALPRHACNRDDHSSRHVCVHDGVVIGSGSSSVFRAGSRIAEALFLRVSELRWSSSRHKSSAPRRVFAACSSVLSPLRGSCATSSSHQSRLKAIMEGTLFSTTLMPCASRLIVASAPQEPESGNSRPRQSSSKIAVAFVSTVSSTLACNPASAIWEPVCVPIKLGLPFIVSKSHPTSSISPLPTYAKHTPKFPLPIRFLLSCNVTRCKCNTSALIVA